MYIAIDIGGTNIRLATTTSLDNPVFENRIQFGNTHSFDEIFENIVRYLDNLDSKIDGIGISVPGGIDDAKSMVIKGHNIPEFNGKPIKDPLVNRYKCKVVLDNDAVVMA